jgi:hypothetical protein
MKKLAFLLALTTANVIACVQNDVSYDILLAQNPNLTCQQLLEQVKKVGLSVEDIDNARKPIADEISKLNSQFADLKWQMIDGQIAFDENMLVAITQKVSSLQSEHNRLSDLRSKIWRRNRDERIARENQQRALRKEIKAKIEAIERGKK